LSYPLAAVRRKKSPKNPTPFAVFFTKSENKPVWKFFSSYPLVKFNHQSMIFKRLNMKLLLRILFFVFLSGSAFSQVDSTQVAAKKKSSTKWRFAAHASYMNLNNSLGYFDVDNGYKLGFSSGPVFNISISPYNGMRIEPYYLFQRFENSFVSDNVAAKTSFTNHALGMDFFPLVLKTKSKIKPTFSLGGYAQYHLNSNSQTEINGTEVPYKFEEFNRFQAGWIVGAGVYLNRTLLEMRLYNAMVDFYPNTVSSNSIRSVSFLIAF
jgi:hypothetical protein